MGWQASPAFAGWKLSSTCTASVAYNQGVAFDQALGNFFFVGVDSTTNSALYRTDSGLSVQAANPAVIPVTTKSRRENCRFGPKLFGCECSKPSMIFASRNHRRCSGRIHRTAVGTRRSIANPRDVPRGVGDAEVNSA